MLDIRNLFKITKLSNQKKFSYKFVDLIRAITYKLMLSSIISFLWKSGRVAECVCLENRSPLRGPWVRILPLPFFFMPFQDTLNNSQ